MFPPVAVLPPVAVFPPVAVLPPVAVFPPVAVLPPVAGAAPPVAGAFPPCAAADTAVGTFARPAVPSAHCSGPLASHAFGCGAFLASVLVPSELNVGFAHCRMSIVCTSTPGILRICSKLASTRFTGIGE